MKRLFTLGRLAPRMNIPLAMRRTALAGGVSGMAGGALLLGMSLLVVADERKPIVDLDDAFDEFDSSERESRRRRVVNWFKRKLSWFWELFPDSKKKPYIPAQLPPQYRKPFVMVVDLEVLLSNNFEGGRGWRSKKRPGVDYFLALAGQVCEIIVFSSKVNPSVGWTLVPRLDAAGAISYKFFDDTHKDIPTLERPIERTLIVTDSPQEYAGYEANVVVLPRWTGAEEEDTSLLELAAFLEDLNRNQNKIADTRKVLKNLAATGKTVTEAYREVAKQKLEKKEEVLSGRRVGFLQ